MTDPRSESTSGIMSVTGPDYTPRFSAPDGERRDHTVVIYAADGTVIQDPTPTELAAAIEGRRIPPRT